MLLNKPAHQIAEIGTERIARPRRLEADKSATGCRNADRAAAVIGMGDRHDARRNRRRGAARGTAGGMREIPGIARRAIEGGLGCRQQAEFGHIGLAENDDACLPEACGQRGIAGCGHARHEARANLRRHTGEIAQNILEEKWHTAKRPVARRLRHGAALVVHSCHNGIECRIVLFNARDCLFREFRRAYLALAHQLRKAKPIMGRIVGYAHSFPPFVCSGTRIDAPRYGRRA